MSLLPWTHPVAEVPAGDRTFKQAATPTERAAVAEALDILDCPRLEASYSLRPVGGGRYAMKGVCSASVVQACIVTLEPVAGELKLSFDCIFDPDPDAAALPSESEEAEVSALPDIEPIEHGRLDAGRVIFETLAAGLDPFPRKDGAEFAWDDPRAGDGRPNPFAVLANLKPKS